MNMNNLKRCETKHVEALKSVMEATFKYKCNTSRKKKHNTKHSPPFHFSIPCDLGLQDSFLVFPHSLFASICTLSITAANKFKRIKKSECKKEKPCVISAFNVFLLNVLKRIMGMMVNLRPKIPNIFTAQYKNSICTTSLKSLTFHPPIFPGGG